MFFMEINKSIFAIFKSNHLKNGADVVSTSIFTYIYSSFERNSSQDQDKLNSTCWVAAVLSLPLQGAAEHQAQSRNRPTLDLHTETLMSLLASPARGGRLQLPVIAELFTGTDILHGIRLVVCLYRFPSFLIFHPGVPDRLYSEQLKSIPHPVV